MIKPSFRNFILFGSFGTSIIQGSRVEAILNYNLKKEKNKTIRWQLIYLLKTLGLVII